MVRQKLALAVCVVMLLSAGCLGLGGSDDPAQNVSDGDEPGQAPGGDDEDTETPDDDAKGDGQDDADNLPDAETLQTEISESGFAFESFQGVVTIDAEIDGQALSGTYNVWEGPTDKLRIEVVDPYVPREADLHVSDGEELWWYDEGKNRYAQEESGAFTAFQGGANLLSDIASNANLTVEGTETVLGRDAIVLNYTQDPESSFTGSTNGTIFLDQETRYPLKIEQRGSTVTDARTTFSVTEATFDADLDDELFEFEPPAGSQSVAEIETPTFDSIGAANEYLSFNVVAPETPANVTFAESRVSESLTETRFIAVYENETVDEGQISTEFSLSVTDTPAGQLIADEKETRDIAGTELTIVRFEDDGSLKTGRVFFELDDLEYTISGRVSEEEFIEIAQSIITQESKNR